MSVIFIGIASVRLFNGEIDEIASLKRREMSLQKVKDFEKIRIKLKEAFKNKSVVIMISDANEFEISKAWRAQG